MKYNRWKTSVQKQDLAMRKGKVGSKLWTSNLKSQELRKMKRQKEVKVKKKAPRRKRSDPGNMERDLNPLEMTLKEKPRRRRKRRRALRYPLKKG